jgi:predicted CopG family antitoxin
MLRPKRLRQIAVDEENYQALKKLGHVPESFNDVITRILKNAGVQTSYIQNDSATSRHNDSRLKEELYQNDIQS